MSGRRVSQQESDSKEEEEEEGEGDEIKDKRSGTPSLARVQSLRIATEFNDVKSRCHRTQRFKNAQKGFVQLGVKGVIFRLKNVETNFPVREFKKWDGGEHQPIAVSMFLLILLPARISAVRRKKNKTEKRLLPHISKTKFDVLLLYRTIFPSISLPNFSP